MFLKSDESRKKRFNVKILSILINQVLNILNEKSVRKKCKIMTSTFFKQYSCHFSIIVYMRIIPHLIETNYLFVDKKLIDYWYLCIKINRFFATTWLATVHRVYVVLIKYCINISSIIQNEIMSSFLVIWMYWSVVQ